MYTMNEPGAHKEPSSQVEPVSAFWISDAYNKTYFKDLDKTAYSYYDACTVFKYLFYHWVHKWVYILSKRDVPAYKFHPLPVSDQLLRWHPIFTKHVSDGLVRLEQFWTSKSQSNKSVARKPLRSILFRAVILTFWKRFLIISLGLVASNVLSLSISIFVKKLLDMLGNDSPIPKTLGLVCAIVGMQLFDSLFHENLNFYVHRLISIIHYLFSTAVFQHAICYRRNFVNNINGSNLLGVCNQVLHSCSPDSECSKNPLYCQALRHQSNEITPKVYSYEWNDSYYFSQAFEAIKIAIEFLTNFSYGVFLLSYQLSMKLWLLYGVGLAFTVGMILLEVFSAVITKYVMYVRDYKLTKCSDIFPNLALIKKMLYDDIAHNIITKCRNVELSLIFFNFFCFQFNNTMYVSCMNVSFILLQRYFIKSINDTDVISDVDTAAFMASFYIFMKIVHSMFLIPRALKVIGMSVVNFVRMDLFLKDCAPNFYITDNKYTGKTQTSNVLVNSSKDIPKDTVIYYKDATFTWVNSREDLLNKNYEPYLKNINFELKRGHTAIVTGSQGAGKSNFIKSMLGEMTLVGGSMAVVPLYTSMPIFYASQDIWLQHGTIRSNIVFGHKFEEDLYNAVLKAVELEFDISTWEKGDMRVVSDNAPSLSGGQRVRMEMARAVYAYLVFHKVNMEYNEGKCSFLMCLDSSFHGLDPYVSKTIFNNLFNQKTGLLMKGDLAVVLTSTRTTLDICLKNADLTNFSNSSIYNITNETLKIYSTLHEFVKNKRKGDQNFKYLTPVGGAPCTIKPLSDDMMKLCSSGSTSVQARSEITRGLFSTSFRIFQKEELSGVKYNRFLIYVRSAAFLFFLYVLLTVSVIVFDTVKFVFSTRLSDYISKQISDYNDGISVDMPEIKSYVNRWLKYMVGFVIAIVSVSFLATISMTAACVISSRKLHEYITDAVFNFSSSVIKVKKQMSKVLTYFSCDIALVDDSLYIFLSLLLNSTLQLLINVVTLFYLIPISIPFVFVAIVCVCFFILLKFVKCTRHMTFGYFETCTYVNNVMENAISGSSINRSFKKDSYFESRFIEQRDYKSRCKFFLSAFPTWTSISFSWIFSFTTLAVLVLPVILDKYTKYELKVGYFGLAISLCSNVLKSYYFFAYFFSWVEMDLVTLDRFKYFIPPAEKLVFKKFHNTHEENLVNPNTKGACELNTKTLVKRRGVEFRAETKRFYFIRWFFFHPRVNVLDLGGYLAEDHKEVQLKDVCVFTKPDHNPQGMIVRHVNASAHRSQIIGIIGRTGAGKTTLLSALQNIIVNRTGQVLLDGKDLNDIPKTVLRQIIGVLPQLPFVFKGWTVRRFLDPRKLFTDDDINRALDQCGLLRFVNELPGGKKLDAVIVPENLAMAGPKSKPVNHQVKHTNEKETSLDLTNPFYESDMLLTNSQLRTLWLAKLVLHKHFYRMILVDEPPEEDAFEEAKNDDLGVPIYELLKIHFTHCTTFLTAHDANVLKSCTNVWVVHDGRLIRTCKTSDIAANESIATIIEESLNM